MSSLSPDERRDLLLSVGTHKRTRRKAPIQVAQLLARLQESMSMEQIADELNMRDTSTLQKFVSLLKLPAEIHPLIIFGGGRGYLSLSVGHLVARLNDPEDIRLLTKDACEKQRTKEEVRAILQRYKRGGIDLVSAIEEIDKTRPQVNQQFLFMGKLPNEVSTPEAQKDAKIKIRVALAKLVGAANVLSVATNAGRFSFMLSEEAVHNPEVAQYLTPDQVEDFVSHLLIKE